MHKAWQILCVYGHVLSRLQAYTITASPCWQIWTLPFMGRPLRSHRPRSLASSMQATVPCVWIPLIGPAHTYMPRPVLAKAWWPPLSPTGPCRWEDMRSSTARHVHCSACHFEDDLVQCWHDNMYASKIMWHYNAYNNDTHYNAIIRSYTFSYVIQWPGVILSGESLFPLTPSLYGAYFSSVYAQVWYQPYSELLLMWWSRGWWTSPMSMAGALSINQLWIVLLRR